MGLPSTAARVAVARRASAPAPLEDTSGGRRRLCEAAGAVFDCVAVGHAWVDVEQRGWSLCLWRHAPAGAGSVTLAGFDPRMRGDVLGAWWPWSECRRAALERIAGPYLVEVPLVAAAPASCSILVLGRERAFAEDDIRLVTVVLAQMAVVERTVLRLEAPVLPPLTSGVVTEREVEVLRLLSAGLIARSIAHRMSVSERTVHKHLEHLYHKLDVHDRLSAVIRAQQLGLLDSRRAT